MPKLPDVAVIKVSKEAKEYSKPFSPWNSLTLAIAERQAKKDIKKERKAKKH